MLEVGKLYKISDSCQWYWLNKFYSNKMILLLDIKHNDLTMRKNRIINGLGNKTIKCFVENRIQSLDLSDEELEYFEEVC